MKFNSEIIKIICLLLLIATSCEKGDEAKPTTQTGQTVNADGRVNLASFKHDSGAQTDFYLISNSTVVIQSTFPVDKGNEYAPMENLKEYTKKINDLKASGKSYADIYVALTGEKVNHESLKAIEKTDLLLNDALQTARSASAGRNLKNQVLTNESSNSTAARTEASCSSDFYNDDYGAAWFKTNFCSFCIDGPFGGTILFPPLGVTNASLKTNVFLPKLLPIPVVDSYTDPFTTIGYLTVMAADFKQGVTVQFRNSCPSGAPSTCHETVYIGRVAKRHISTFLIGPNLTDDEFQGNVEVLSTNSDLTCTNRIHYEYYFKTYQK